MTEELRTATDPVCGMTVEIETATDASLKIEEDAVIYYFCGRGCKLDFRDDPARYLDPGYKPLM